MPLTLFFLVWHRHKRITPHKGGKRTKKNTERAWSSLNAISSLVLSADRGERRLIPFSLTPPVLLPPSSWRKKKNCFFYQD